MIFNLGKGIEANRGDEFGENGVGAKVKVTLKFTLQFVYGGGRKQHQMSFKIFWLHILKLHRDVNKYFHNVLNLP